MFDLTSAIESACFFFKLTRVASCWILHSSKSFLSFVTWSNANQTWVNMLTFVGMLDEHCSSTIKSLNNQGWMSTRNKRSYLALPLLVQLHLGRGGSTGLIQKYLKSGLSGCFSLPFLHIFRTKNEKKLALPTDSVHWKLVNKDIYLIMKCIEICVHVKPSTSFSLSPRLSISRAR